MLLLNMSQSVGKCAAVAALSFFFFFFEHLQQYFSVGYHKDIEERNNLVFQERNKFNTIQFFGQVSDVALMCLWSYSRQ